MNKPKTTLVKATQTSLQVVSAIEELGEEATITEIANHLQLAKSTAYKHLVTLEEYGIVVEHTNGYRIGSRCLELGGIAQRYDSIYEIAKPEVQKMSEATGELANLMFEEQGYGVYTYTARGDQAVNIENRLGKRVPLHTTALGKALLSSYSDERIVEVVNEYGLPAETEETITDQTALFDELSMIREEGFAYNRGERVDGLGCIATPIETGNRRNAAISITMPISRLDPDQMEHEFREILNQAANVIELNLAHENQQ